MRLLLVSAVVLSVSAAPGQAAEKTYDVVISGAGSGGVSAAIEAARHGASVALLEETDWIGGQMTAAGVPNMDEHYLNVQSGIYWEFISRVQAQYAARGKSISTCYWSDRSHCFEPSVGQKILYAMIAEARKPGHTLDVMLRTRVERVLAAGNHVEGVVTSSGATIRSKVLIDATEYGDVLPLVPGQYRTGKYIGKDVDANGCVQWITYTAVVKKYPTGVPEKLRMKNPPPGYAEARNKFARQIQADGNPVDRVLPVNWAIHNAAGCRIHPIRRATRAGSRKRSQRRSSIGSTITPFRFPCSIGPTARR
jgi:FAD-dependent oxidoreductase family protein